jgi:hypothetical protein|eukprot:COSAG01_NODE_196_length_22350_cov_812.929136_25_plen_403_part_00
MPRRAGHALAVLLATAVATAAAGQHTCTPGADDACAAPVCAQCCKTWIQPDSCDGCVEDECGKPPAPVDVCAWRPPTGANATCAPECVKECLYKPWAPCLRDCEFCTVGKPLFLVVLVPFLGRALLDWALKALWRQFDRRCCSNGSDEAVVAPERNMSGYQRVDMVGRTVNFVDGQIVVDEGFPFDALLDKGSSWANALEANGQRPLSALAGAAVRLLLWHWLQPALYFAVLGCYWGEIDRWQRRFGVAVAVREAMYFATTLLALRLNPAFLLVDVPASVRNDETYTFLAMYVLAPEKFVASAVFSNGGLGCSGNMGCLSGLGGLLLDFCGVGALVAGLVGGSLPVALAVGYGATALGGLTAIAMVGRFCAGSSRGPGRGRVHVVGTHRVHVYGRGQQAIIG